MSNRRGNWLLRRYVCILLAPIEVIGCTLCCAGKGAAEGWRDGVSNVKDWWRVSK